MSIQLTPDDTFLLMLLGHVLGDFYLQTNAMVRRKQGSLAWLLIHGAAYAACILAVLLIGLADPGRAVLLGLTSGALHLLIDWLKPLLSLHPWAGKRLMLIDQLAHVLLLVLVWLALGQHLSPRWFVAARVTQLGALPLPALLAALILLRPVGLMIGSGALGRLPNPPTEDGSIAHSGRMIGYLERLITLFFLMHAQFTAIVFVLTAKGLVRFDELKKKDGISPEYFLIGTLLSVCSALLTALLLGLIPA